MIATFLLPRKWTVPIAVQFSPNTTMFPDALGSMWKLRPRSQLGDRFTRTQLSPPISIHSRFARFGSSKPRLPNRSCRRLLGSAQLSSKARLISMWRQLSRRCGVPSSAIPLPVHKDHPGFCHVDRSVVLGQCSYSAGVLAQQNCATCFQLINPILRRLQVHMMVSELPRQGMRHKNQLAAQQ